jgi:hypothetical protein
MCVCGLWYLFDVNYLRCQTSKVEREREIQICPKFSLFIFNIISISMISLFMLIPYFITISRPHEHVWFLHELSNFCMITKFTNIVCDLCVSCLNLLLRPLHFSIQCMKAFRLWVQESSFLSWRKCRWSGLGLKFAHLWLLFFIDCANNFRAMLHKLWTYNCMSW